MDNTIHILVDADSIYFKAACVTKKKHEIRKVIKRKMVEIERDCSFFFTDIKMMVAVKGIGNFRFDFLEDYKGVRPDLEDDMKEALNYGNQFMLEHYDTVAADNMEADDLVSVWAHQCWENGLNYIIAHIDKDLNMIPGPHYNFDKQDLYEISPDEGYYKFMHQCLTGDRTDNIKGIKGIGPKKADKILESCGSRLEMWTSVKDAWSNSPLEPIDLVSSMRALWMATCWDDLASRNLAIVDRLEDGDCSNFWRENNEA